MVEILAATAVFGGADWRDSTHLGPQRAALHAALTLFPRRHANTLYVASSYGLGMKLLAEAGFPVQGIDIDPRALSFCTSQGLSVSHMDAANLNFPEGTFDMVVSRDFVCPGYPAGCGVKLLNAQHKVTRNGGYVVLTSMIPTLHEGKPYCVPHSLGFPDDLDFRHSKLAGIRPIEGRVPIPADWWGGEREIMFRAYRKR